MLIQIKFFSCFIIIHFLIGTSYAKQNPDCPPSSCGNIRNISHPFRLKDHPGQCGDPKYELACENNTTFLYFNTSQKYLVQAINYSDYTIRLADATINTNDNCSFPKYSLTPGDLRQLDVPYIYMNRALVIFMSCPYPVHNSLLLEIPDRCVEKNYGPDGRRKHMYIKLGLLNGSYVMDNCTIELMVMTSLPLKEEENVSLSEIHSSLLYGFELSFGFYTINYWVCWPTYHRLWVQIECDSLGPIPVLIKWAIWILGFPGTRFTVYGVVPYLVLRMLIGMPCMLGLLIYKFRRRHLSTFDIIEGFLQSNNNLMPIRYSYSDLKKITRGFQEKLGEGGYGSVYKGKLRSGHDVAVKLISKNKSNGQDFMNEVATIGRIHHVNVVKLVGYCAERSKSALLYDFMPNGSLEKHIFTKQKTNSLSWKRKYEIAIGVARGIEYLHKGCDIQILHFDIKPHNILLDENFTPKISDFGLAKFYSVEKDYVTLTAARGTIGYVAPELINRSIGEVSHKADVYSFGMLLMEMVDLKRNKAADDDKSTQYFPDWIYDRFNKGKDIEIGNVDEIDEDNGDNECERKVIKKMTIVGLRCIQLSPSYRPSMSEVLKMLEGENEDLQVPPQPSQSLQIECYNDDQMCGAEWTDSSALLGRDASSA